MVGGDPLKIGLIGAMDEEIALFLEQIKEPEEIKVANSLFVKGRLQDKEVILLKSGIGKVNAAMTTTILHERFSPTMVLNTGSAGGFSQELSIGDIVISEEVVHHDVDATVFDYAYGQVPQMPPMYKGDAELVQLAQNIAEEIGLQAKTGLIATGDSFMEDDTRVSIVREKFPSMLAAEMEAAAVAQVCYQYDTPFVVIRAISDIAGEESSISFEAFLDRAVENTFHLLMRMVKQL